MTDRTSWDIALSGLAVAMVSLEREYEPNEVLEGMVRALVCFVKSGLDPDDEEQLGMAVDTVGAFFREEYQKLDSALARHLVQGIADIDDLEDARILTGQLLERLQPIADAVTGNAPAEPA